MPLFINHASIARPDDVLIHLGRLLMDDPTDPNGQIPASLGQGSAPPAGPDVRQVSYTPPAAPDTVQQRISDIINSGFANRIIVTGATSSNAGPSGTPMSTKGVEILPLDPLSGDLVFWYDVIPCDPDGEGGADPKNWCATDQAGNVMTIRNEILLYHGLTIQFHVANGSVIAPPGDPVSQALADDNAALTKFGDPNVDPADLEHSVFRCGGCLGLITVGNSCFIASAAFSSSLAPQVQEFRRIRDVVLRRSSLGDDFFARLFAEYYRFSPRVAADMEISPALKTSIRKVVVEPLLDLFSLTERYVRGGWQQEDFEDQVEGVLVRFLDGLPEAELNQDQVESIYSALTYLKARLGSSSDAEVRQEVSPVPSASSDPVEVLDYLAGEVMSSESDVEYLSWAIMIPLTIYWSALAKLKSKSTQRSNPGSYFTEAIDDWLSTAPIPPIFAELSEDAARDDLSQLAQTVFAIPRVRRRFGTRLMETYGDRVSFDLKAVLQATGYSSDDLDD